MRAGFLANLGEEAIMFAPEPTAAVAHWEASEDAPGLLTWRPETADASTAGDIGFTTGPWELRSDGASGEAVAFGHYVSVWLRSPDAEWKVAFDAGVPHAPVDVLGTEVEMRGVVRTDAPLESPAVFEDVLDAERLLWTEARNRGFPEALEGALTHDSYVLRTGELPARGPSAGRALVSGESDPAWEPAGGYIAESGDLAYTYGTAFYRGEDGSTVTSKSSYVRIWEYLPGGAWKIVIDMTSPIPDPEP
jgi:ketosteroid isomerase-like protein